jgi:hypothetical protein
MASPLRVMGFVPALVHMAWAQVILAQPQQERTSPIFVGLGALACLVLLGAGCAVALEMGWLGEHWQGMRLYLLPLVVWQGSASVAAAFSHLPFIDQKGSRYSMQCVSLAASQFLALTWPILLFVDVTPTLHFLMFALMSSVGLLSIAFWCWYGRSK